MRRYQTGEVMMAMMVVMLVVVWLASGRMGMMGHGAAHAERAADTEQQAKAEPSPVSKESPEPQH